MPNQKKRNKGPLQSFLLALLLSCGIWIIHNLSLEYTDVVSVPVVAHSNIPGRADVSSNEVQISARCNCTGFFLLSNRLFPKGVVDIEFEAADFEKAEEDYFTISDETLERYFSQIFGKYPQLVSIVSRHVKFSFAQQASKKVPLRALRSLSFKPQYMALEDIQLSKDSIMVYGEPSRLKNVDMVLTQRIDLNDLKRSVRGIAKLENPGGVRLECNEVDYSLEVVRYVEFRSRVSIGKHNVPAGVDLSVYPLFADATFRCLFPSEGNPVDRMEFYVDYADFAKSISGKCVIRWDALPDGVIDCHLQPQVCECVEKVQ